MALPKVCNQLRHQQQVCERCRGAVEKMYIKKRMSTIQEISLRGFSASFHNIPPRRSMHGLRLTQPKLQEGFTHRTWPEIVMKSVKIVRDSLGQQARIRQNKLTFARSAWQRSAGPRQTFIFNIHSAKPRSIVCY